MTHLVDDRVIRCRLVVSHSVDDLERLLIPGVDSVKDLVITLDGTVRLATTNIKTYTSLIDSSSPLTGPRAGPH
jgi:hypothetical protein